jgi:hypothetical protein
MLRIARRTGVIVSLVAVASAGPAFAGGFGDPLTSSDTTVVIRTSDLRLNTGVPVSVTSLQWGTGAFPSGCVPLDDGRSKGRPAPRSFYREILAKPDVRWQSAVYGYGSVDSALRSYEQLLDGSLSTCSGEVPQAESPNGDAVPSTATMTARMLPNTAADRPRFTVSTSWVIDDPGAAPDGAVDRYSYSCAMLVNDAIIDVVLFQPTPISAARKAEVRRLTNVVGSRYSAHP